MINEQHLQRRLVDRYGLALRVQAVQKPDDSEISIEPIGLERTRSFYINFGVGWRSLIGKFNLGAYAKDLLDSMSRGRDLQQNIARVFAQSIAANGGKLTVEVNEQIVDADSPSSWGEEWRSFVARLEVIGDFSNEPELNSWIERFFGYCLAFVPLEGDDCSSPSEIDPIAEGSPGVAEGQATYIYTKRYERSRKNRAACIELHGLSCTVCGFSFRERYGDAGDGYIHIHHLKPVSAAEGKEHLVDPAIDLVPVCPNCHAIIHRRIPPYSPDEVRELIAKNL